MSAHPTTLKRVPGGDLIDAELHDGLSLDALFEAEELWAPERVRILRDCVKATVSNQNIPQSWHWNWSRKTLKLRAQPTGAFSPYCLFGVKAEGQWQGLSVCHCVGHTARITAEPKDLVYLDMLESAPWNWEVAAIGRMPRFRGVGKQLVELAVRWSDDLGFKGRVGLHSLQQAEVFYRNRCGMTDLGPDEKYKQMRYFELSEAAARAFLQNEPS